MKAMPTAVHGWMPLASPATDRPRRADAIADLRGRAYRRPATGRSPKAKPSAQGLAASPLEPSVLTVGSISPVPTACLGGGAQIKKKTNPGKLALFSSVPAHANPLLRSRHPRLRAAAIRILLALLFLMLPAMAAGGEAPEAPPDPNVVNMEFHDTDLPTVLRTLCQGAKLDFVLEPDVQGKVTAKLRNTAWQAALDIILKSNGLEAKREGNTLVISRARPGAAPAAEQRRVRVTPQPNGRLDFDASGADVREAVGELAAAAKLNIVASKDVAGLVTASLRGLLPEEVLAAIADSCGATLTEKGHTIFLVPRPPAPAAPAPGEATTQLGPKAEAKPKVERLPDGKLAVHATASPLRDLLAELSRAAGLNIVAAPDVAGSISLDLSGAPVQDVLAAIATHSSITFKPLGSVLYASPTVPGLQTETFRLRHSKAEEVGKVVTECVDGAKMATDPTNNLLVVSGTAEAVAAVRAIVEKIETAPTQVTIEARIIETNLTGEKWLGIEWSNAITTSINFDDGIPLDAGSCLSYGILSTSGLTMVLHMLQQNTLTQLIANPTVTTVENKEAVIKIVTKFPMAKYQVSSETGLLTVSGFDYTEFGTSLTVTPRVSGNHIVLDVHPEISRQAGKSSFQGAEVPIIESQETQTQVRIKDGDTLVIAGLIREDSEKTRKRMPFLWRIPLLGALFRSSHDKLDARRNLLIFITPHIVKDLDFTTSASLRQEHTEPVPVPDRNIDKYPAP